MFDFRKNHQYFKRADHKNVYLWKQKNDTYHIGINGTSHHYSVQGKDEAKMKVRELLSIAIA